MPDRRKKKTREDAVRMLQQRAANSGIKNEAQQKAWESGFKGSRSNADTKTATTPQTSRTTQSTNSSTTPRNSLQTSQRGSQSPSVSRRSPSLTDVANRRNLVTSERAKRTQLTTPTRRTSSINNIDDRRSGRYRNDRREQQSYVNTPRNRVQYDKGKTTIGDRVADTLKGSAKQWAGGHMSSVGTAAQFAEPTVRGIQKTEYRDPSETGYSLRSRKEAELRQNERTQNIALKEGRDLRTFKGRDYSDKNANLQAFIKSADSLIDSGSRDIERAKKGAGKLGSFAIDTMSNMAQMGGDLAANVALPGLGMVALGMRSAGMGSYQARQQGLDVNEQALHGLIDGVVEMGSEAIFGGVSALQKTYGKGMFSLADKLGWRTASSEMVRRLFKTDFGQALATHLSRLGAGMLEEGTEELIADVFEPALKYVFTKANNPDYKFEGTDLKQMGYDFLLGAMTAGVLGGGSTVAGIRADSQAFVDGQNYAQDLVNRARVQGREGMATTNAEILGGRLQSQMERGIEASPYQIRTLQEAVGESQLANAIDYEKRNAERYQQAVDEGRADTVKQQGTYQEYEGYRRRVDDTLERNYERARSVMGEDASEESVNAVRNVITGSTDNYDIDTVLTDNEAKKAVETLTGTKLSVNNQTARNEIENIALTRQIQNRDAILQETHESIRTEMSKRGGQLFDGNYDRAVETLDVPNGANIYDSFFSRFYTDGTVQNADFDKSYNRIMGSIREDFGDELAGKIGEVFNMDFAQKVFAEGQMAQATYNAKYQGKALSLKASENPAGFTYEDTARAKISDRQADLLTKFAERANIHIRLVDSIAGGSANGSYENGVIMIAADSTNKLVTVAKHELTHHIRSTSPELYQKLEDFIFNKYYEWDADALENKIREYQERGYNMTAEKIKEEIVADASEAFFTDEGSIHAVVNHDRGLAQAIHDGIKTLLDTLLDLQESDNLSKRGYGDFLDDIDILREAERMWLDALNDTVEKSREARPSAETESEVEALEGENLFSIKDDKARWTDDRIDDLIKLYGASDKSYSRAYAVLMNPRDYLKLTLSDENLERWNEKAKEGGDNSLRKLDQNDLANMKEDAPYLTIYSNDGNMVQGHEGRHRMRALLEAGVKSVPVVIRDTDTKYTKQNVDSMTLSSQDFGYDPVNNNAEVTIRGLVPIKESNRAELIEKFGGEAGVKFSIKEDQDYMDAVNRGDMETAQRMVDEEAKRHGLTSRLMHGTNSFGFTTVEYGKGDDHISFFATDNEEVASSYVRPMFDDDEPNTYVRSIGKPIKNRVNEQSPIGDIINALNKVRQSSYKVATEEIIKSETDEQFRYVLEDAKELDRYTLPDKIQDVIEKVANSKDPQEAISLMDSIKDVHDIYYNDMLFYQATAKLSGLKSNVDLLKRELQWTPDNVGYWDINGHKNFVSKTDVYEEYLDETGLSGRGIYELYASTNKPLTVYCNGSTWDNIKTTGAMVDDLGQTATTRQIAKWAYDHGYGTVIFDYVRDTGKYGDRFTNPSTVYAFLEGGNNVIKSADPVTYDDEGNVIPLSERFNQENEDIRYSVKETETTDRNINKLDKSGNVLTTKSGEPIAKFEKDGSAQFSLKTYEDDGRRIYRDYLNKMVKSGELKRAEADQMYNELETIYKITREYADSGKYVPFTAWSNAEVVIGENGKPVFSAIKANSEYKMNIDFSTICKKRRTLDNVFRVMVNRGLFEQLDLNKDESAALVVNINDLIREHGFEAACALCFVEARRYRQQQTATTFRDMWNGLVESMYKDKSKIEHFNYGKNESVREVPDGIHTMSDKDLDLSYVRKLATAKNDEGKLLQTAEAKAARLLLENPSQRKLMLIGDMMASTGFENMQVKNPELMKIYNAKKGTGGAKSSFGDVQYLNEIINSKTFDRKKAYAVSGVRIQSFSDYVPRMVFDYVQVIADLAAKRLPAHAYTKEVLFVLQFGLTGAKINMSLVPDVVKDGIAPGLDKDGNYVWNTDGTFPWEDYKDDKGRTWPGARSIQKAKGYKENCGTIAVGISDEQIWKMLADPEIQMVIPYHKSSLNPLVAQMTNVHRFTDYTDYQNTKTRDGKNVPKEFDWDNKLFELSHGKDGKLLPKSEWGDIQDLVQEYVDWCNENDYVPKFERFLYMKDGSINPGYYKMLEDFALLDEEGNFKPQDDVRLRFPTEDDAFGSMASLIEQGLSEDTNLESKRSNEIEGIVDEIEEMIDNGTATKPSIISEALADKMEGVDLKHSLKEDTDAFFEARKEQKLWNEKGKGYFDKAMAFYSQYQEGQANKDNFFVETIAKFKQIARRPSREPDHVSLNSRAKVSSEYWYTKDGVIRGSNHWGTGIASCDWALEETNGRTIYGREGLEPTKTGKVYGRANWSDFIHKTTIRDGELTSFENQPEGKYQLKDLDSTQTIASQNTIAKLEDQVKDLKAEFKRTDLKTADQKQARIQAGKLIQRHGSNMGVQKDLENTFNKIFRLYKEKGTDAFDEVYEIAKDAAVNVVNNISEVRSEGREEYDAIKQYLRETPITISEDMKKNITDYNEFRKRNFGKLKLKNGETSNIDNVYMELMEMFPEQFTDDYVNPHDQLNHIIDVLDNFAPYYETLDGASEEMQDYVVEIAADIMETAYNLQTKKTFADKKYLEKEAAVKKAREKALESRNKELKRITTRYQKQVESLKGELWKANERTAAERLRGEMDIQRLKKQQAESKEKARERKAESRERTKLLNVARRLDKLKTTEANRQQIDALIGDLDLVAKGMTDKSLEKLTDLQSWYDDRAQNDPDFIPDSNIENKLKRLSKTHIKDMTIEEVRDLYDVLSNIENEIATEKKLIDSEVKKEIYEAGKETIRDINRSHGIAKSLRKLDTFFISGTLSPLRQIRRVTGYVDSDPLYIATKELADGQRKMLQYQMDSWKAFDRFMNDKDFINSLNGRKAEEIEVTGMKNGEPFKVKITPDIRMAMYLAGMNEDNLRHMKYGGITLPDIKLYKKGKISEAMESGETVKFSPSQIKEITSHMSKREKEFAQEAYKYYNITSPQAINEVSEVLKGYSLARVNNYFPIHTDQNFLTKEFESMKFDGTIEGMGFLKERVRASNPILMTGLVDTLTKSIEMNSKYVGLAIPVRNFSKILNVKDMSWDEEGNAEFRGAVKKSISKKWGKSVLNYIEKFMTDLQNGRKSSDEWGSVFSKARSRYAGAVLTLNASVAIKQAASYPTAAAVLGWAPLAKAMGNVGKVDLDLIAKYTPLQWYRSKGYSTTELGDITSSRTGNIPTPLNWIQGMDLLTTRKLWKASEYYVRQHNKNLKTGTDEYYKAVADIYNRVIEETQPNYTTMQRPGLLRSDNEITLTLNMFKTQPYQNFNILFDAFGNYTAKRNQYKSSKSIESKKALKEANRDMQNAVTSQIAQLAVFAAMTSLWALFRRKDDKYKDEEGKLTIFSYMKKLGEDMISNLFADVPLGADIYSMASSVFTGDTYYGFTSVTDSAITDVMDSFKNGAVAVGDWIEYGRSDNPEKKPSSDMYKETENVISSASRAMGIPASNLRNLVNGIYGWVAISADGEYIGTYEAQKMTFAREKEMKQNLFRAYQNDKAAYEELRKMMIEDGFDEEKLDDYITWQRREHHTEEEQKAIDSSMQKLEGSNIWKDATEEEKTDFTNRVTNMALGITNSDTESITKYAVNGLTNEQVILYKLALKKADRQNDNNKSYNNDEKEAAIRMLERNYKLTEQQKKTLTGKKS